MPTGSKANKLPILESNPPQRSKEGSNNRYQLQAQYTRAKTTIDEGEPSNDNRAFTRTKCFFFLAKTRVRPSSSHDDYRWQIREIINYTAGERGVPFEEL